MFVLERGKKRTNIREREIEIEIYRKKRGRDKKRKGERDKIVANIVENMKTLAKLIDGKHI